MTQSINPNIARQVQSSNGTKWNTIASNESLEKAVNALQANGIVVYKASNGEEATKKVFELIPEGSEILEQQSMTLKALGLDKIVQESGKYKTPKKVLAAIQDPVLRMNERRRISVTDYTIGSANAITESGQIVFASAGGSQLASYTYTAKQVILIVGTNKIVKNLDEAMKRINEYILPLETDRLRTAMNNPNVRSGVNKILIVNKEYNNRMTVIFVPEQLGF